MTTSFANHRSESAATNDDARDSRGDNTNSGKQSLTSEATNMQGQYKAPDIASMTMALENKHIIPSLRLFEGGANQSAQELGENKSKSNGDNGNFVDPNKSRSAIDGGSDKKATQEGLPQNVGDKDYTGQTKPGETKEQSDLAGMNKHLADEDKEFDKETSGVADSVGKDGGFGSGVEGRRNEEAMERAFANGTLDEFVKDVNAKLEKAGSPYRVSANQYSERMKYRQDVGNKAINPQVQEHDNPRANISVTDKRTGRSYEMKRMAHDPQIKGYGKPSASKGFGED